MHHSYFEAEKLVHSYFMPEKLICSNLEYQKNGSQLFVCLKIWFTAISSQKNCLAAIWKEKKVVHKSLEQEIKR